MKVDVYTEGEYLIFEVDGVVFYDFKKEDFEIYQRQLIDKNWHTIEVEKQARRLCHA